jgi:hypothetical protein
MSASALREPARKARRATDAFPPPAPIFKSRIGTKLRSLSASRRGSCAASRGAAPCQVTRSSNRFALPWSSRRESLMRHAAGQRGHSLHET